MNKEDINIIKREKTELRQFGIMIGIVLGLLGSFFLWRDKGYYPYFLFLSTVFLFLGMVGPLLLKPVYKSWMILGNLLGWVNTRIIMGILFYLILTPIGLILRLFGKRFLDLRRGNFKPSYWKRRTSKEIRRDDYERQF